MASHRHDDFDLAQFVEEITYEEIDRKEKVGNGSFGTVYRAKWRNIDVAVKLIEFESNAFIREVRQMARVSHKNIVRLYGACTKRPNVCLVMEYCEYSLYKILHVQRNISYSAGHAISWALQCAEGVAYLHAMKPKPLIHRDLKPPNLLLRECGTILKICDFGTVADKATQMTNNRGSAAWMAPEVFKTSNYTEKCDVYSWSLILWEMLSRKQPFNELGNVCSIMWYVHEGNRPPVLEGCPKCLETIMSNCWDQEPTNRPSMATVVDLMTKLLPLFPGGEQSLNFDSLERTFVNDFEDSSTIDDDSYTGDTTFTSKLYKNSSRSTTGIQMQEYWALQFDQKIRQTTQLSDRMNGLLNNSSEVPLMPLQVDIDKNAWSLPGCDINDELAAHSKGFLTYPSNSQGNERLTITKRSGSSESTVTTTGTSDSSNSEFDKNSIKYMLDPHLRPITPDPTSRVSKEIYADHIRKSEEYLKVQTELAYAKHRKDELLAQMSPKKREEKLKLLELLKEKEEILKIRDTMIRQCEALNVQRQQQQQHASDTPTDEMEEGFIMIPKK